MSKRDQIRAYFARILHHEGDARELRLNHDTGLIKILACLLMLCDHMGKMILPNAWKLNVHGSWAFLLPGGNILRLLGRLAMPMFCYCIAVGCKYTRNLWKYAGRMLLLAILVQPLYLEAMGHVRIGGFDWAADFYRVDLIYSHYYSNIRLNILFSLVMGALIIGCIRTKAYTPMVFLILLTWHLQNWLDYGYKGVLLIVIFYALLDHPLASFAAVSLYLVNWGMPQLFTYGRTNSNSELYTLLSLPLIYAPMKRRVKLPKWVFYAFYPGHLLLIYLLQVWGG